MGFMNWWAVLVCTAICMITGSIWYAPKTFFEVWWKVVGNGKKRPSTGNMALTWVLTILSAAVQALFIGLAVYALRRIFGGVNILGGLLTGFSLWLGFIAPTYLVNKLFAGHGLKIWAIEVGNHLLNFLIMGAIFGLWKLPH